MVVNKNHKKTEMIQQIESRKIAFRVGMHRILL